jgi:hypothetical protein
VQLQTQEELGRLLKEQMASQDAQRALQVITTLRTACNSYYALYAIHLVTLYRQNSFMSCVDTDWCHNDQHEPCHTQDGFWSKVSWTNKPS